MKLDDRLVNIKNRAKLVTKALKDPNLHEQIIKNYNIQELENFFGLEDYDKRLEKKYPTKEHHHLFTFDNTCYRLDTGQGMICIMGAKMIAKLFMMQNPLSWDIRDVDYKSLLFRTCNPYSILDMRGVFVFDMTHTFESHGFVLYITNDHITIYNTYGGYTKFYTKTFLRIEWVKNLVDFFDSELDKQKADYHKLWGFTKPMVLPSIKHNKNQCVLISMTCAQIL